MSKHVLQGFNLAWLGKMWYINFFLSNRTFKLLIHFKHHLFKIEKAPISNDPEGITTCLCRMRVRPIYLASDIQTASFWKDAHCVAPLWELFSARAINSMLICVTHFPHYLPSLLHPLTPRSLQPHASNSDRLTPPQTKLCSQWWCLIKSFPVWN